ncbi:hypothetical protein SCUCBS95973_007830 [Sporothrix curviconia]|uniref:Heterokaryon incompatibility domain-containing protein n=1 Tax=Sporothrix curviconia TaxID=1260050 RepID=A0ABP0CHB8_9PEZI
MFAAGRDLDSERPWADRRGPGPVGDGPLSQRVAVTLGAAASLSVPAREIQDDPICALNISKTLGWADECEKHHGQCNGSYPWFRSDGAAGPARLIDVGPPGHPSIKLVSTNGRRLKYAALSYCWGDRHSRLITEDKNVGWMTTAGAPLTRLSQTIQDAVEVVRSLGMAYLWVDALCIVQGQPDEADWKAESGKMGFIYANAYLTIATTSAASASQGFLRSSHRSGIPVNFMARKAGPCDGKIYFREHTQIGGSFYEDVVRSPLLKRAWVKQERVLSRRTVDFSSRQIYWTCRRNRYSEDGQEDGEGAANEAALLQSLGISGMSRNMREEMMHGLFFRSWGDLIEE